MGAHPAGGARPYDFKLANGELFAFTGLSTGWHDRTRDEAVLSCMTIGEESERIPRPACRRRPPPLDRRPQSGLAEIEPSDTQRRSGVEAVA
jgi:hypothetical protein